MNKIQNCSALILCGGQSKRMGFDKAFLKVNGVYLLDIIYAQLEEIFDCVYLVADQKKKFASINFSNNFLILEDIYQNIGPMGGIYTGLYHSPSPYLFVTACDMPKIDLHLARDMYQALASHQAVLCKKGAFLEPLHAFYHRSCLPSFSEKISKKDYYLQSLYQSLDCVGYPLTSKSSAVFQCNLNDPLDLKEFLLDGQG